MLWCHLPRFGVLFILWDTAKGWWHHPLEHRRSGNGTFFNYPLASFLIYLETVWDEVGLSNVQHSTAQTLQRLHNYRNNFIVWHNNLFCDKVMVTSTLENLQLVFGTKDFPFGNSAEDRAVTAFGRIPNTNSHRPLGPINWPQLSATASHRPPEPTAQTLHYFTLTSVACRLGNATFHCLTYLPPLTAAFLLDRWISCGA